MMICPSKMAEETLLVFTVLITAIEPKFNFEILNQLLGGIEL